MSGWGNEESGNFTHIILLPRTVYCCHFSLNLKIWRTMQLLLPHNLLTYLHSQSHHSRFTHAAILVLTSPCTATIGYILFLFTWQVPHYNRNTFKSLSSSNQSHIVQMPHIFRNTFDDLVQTMCIHEHFSHPYSHHAIFTSPTPAHYNTLYSSWKNFMNKLRQMSLSITSNCIRIDSQYSPHPVPMSLWLLQALNYHPSTPDMLQTMLIGNTTFPSFPHPTFWQWHWSLHNIYINNSSIHGSWFREEVISY